MPTEPMAEPTLEELSAYLDHELDAATETRVSEHLTTCAECQLRLDGLRDTAHAVRALPMETPPRTFTIPERRQQPFRWAPVGWVGGVAAAFLLVALGVTQVHGPGPTTASSGVTNYKGGAAPAPAAGLNNQGSADQNAASRAFASINSTRIADPRNASRTMTLSTDAKSYPAKGALTVDVEFTGLSQDGTTVLILYLERNGYGVLLQTGSVPLDIHGFHRSYTLANLALTDPVPGVYNVIAIEQLPGSNGEMLVARLPITIQQ